MRRLADLSVRWTCLFGAELVAAVVILTYASGWGVARSEYWGSAGSLLLTTAFVVGLSLILVVAPLIAVGRRLRDEEAGRVARIERQPARDFIHD